MAVWLNAFISDDHHNVVLFLMNDENKVPWIWLTNQVFATITQMKSPGC